MELNTLASKYNNMQPMRQGSFLLLADAQVNDATHSNVSTTNSTPTRLCGLVYDGGHRTTNCSNMYNWGTKNCIVTF